MPITGGQTQAYDEVFDLILAGLTPLPDPALRIVWADDLEEIDAKTPVIGITMQHTLGRQASLACDGAKRKWASEGLIYMRIRCPAGGAGLTNINALVNVCVATIRGNSTPGGVWFRNVVGREQPPKDGNSQAVVSGEFYYQEIG